MASFIGPTLGICVHWSSYPKFNWEFIRTSLCCPEMGNVFAAGRNRNFILCESFVNSVQIKKQRFNTSFIVAVQRRRGTVYLEERRLKFSWSGHSSCYAVIPRENSTVQAEHIAHSARRRIVNRLYAAPREPLKTFHIPRS